MSLIKLLFEKGEYSDYRIVPSDLARENGSYDGKQDTHSIYVK